jgi:hypothetical protein
MPLLGNAFFMPFISVLFDVYVCEEAHGPHKDELGYTDSFMYRNCSMDCWTDSHLSYAIVTAIALSLYHPVTVMTRPLWQELTPDLHIKTRHSFYLRKSFVEMTLVLLRRGLRKQHRYIHGVLYISTILGHSFLSLLTCPFNYRRLNLWFYFSMVIVMWTGTFSTLDGVVDSFTGPHAFGLLFGVGGGIICEV